MELVKLLCLADREALLRLECPITGDLIMALPHGLVLSHVLDLIRWGPMSEEDAPWFEAISPPDGYDVKALEPCGDDELSGAEDQILSEIFAKYGKMNWKQLSRLTHGFPEWTDPGGGRIPISPEQILRLGGKSAEQIEKIRNEMSAYQRMDRDVAAYQNQEFEDSEAVLA